MTAQKTLDITQQLRENIKRLLITALIAHIFLMNNSGSAAGYRCPEISLSSVAGYWSARKSKAFNSEKVTAHTAIIRPPVCLMLTHSAPTSAMFTCDRTTLSCSVHAWKSIPGSIVAIQCGDESFYARARKTTDRDLRRFLARKPQT